MGYRFSWVVGLAAIGFAFAQLDALIRPTAAGIPWQIVVMAAFGLGFTITWAGWTYRLRGRWLVVLNTVTIAAAARAMTTDGSLVAEIHRAIVTVRQGIEPVAPRPGIVLIAMAVFWMLGALLAWGVLASHPHVAVIPPLVVTLQLSTMDRAASSIYDVAVFVSLVGASILAIAADERANVVGRMARRGEWSSPTRRVTPMSLSFLGITVAAALIASVALHGSAPPDGWLEWRMEGAGGRGTGGSYDPYVSIRQRLVNPSDQPVLTAEVSGGIGADSVYFQLATLSSYADGSFSPAGDDLEPLTNPIEPTGAAFAGPTTLVTAEVTINGLRQDALPTISETQAVTSDESVQTDLWVVPSDGSIAFPGQVTYDGLTYTLTARVPEPDLDVLATGTDGALTPAFRRAAAAGIDQAVLPTPTPPVTIRDGPLDISRYLGLPDDPETRIEEVARLARLRVQGLESDFERALALEHWFHTGGFTYALPSPEDVEASSADLAAWLLDPDHPLWKRGYCENFATAMAVMARTLDIPSRVVLGFSPGSPIDPTVPDRVVVSDRNAHAWVELWMPSQGWVPFDPTPRTAADTPQAFERANRGYGFAVTNYLAPAVVEGPGGGGTPPTLPQDSTSPPTTLVTVQPAGEPLRIPAWVLAALRALAVVAVVAGFVPSIKWWRRRRRMARLRDGDIRAAWEDLIDRLDDLSEPVAPSATPHEVANDVDPAMAPLAATYGRATYGPEGSITQEHIAEAERSHAETTSRLRSRFSPLQRTWAWYRLRSLRPRRRRRGTRSARRRR